MCGLFIIPTLDSIGYMLRHSSGSSLVRFVRGYADYKIKRRLRLPKSLMYEVVGDVNNYHNFVPYCLDSKVTKTSANGRPENALLKVGWNQLEEEFESKLEYTEDQVRATAANNRMFKDLECEWTITELPRDQCVAALKLNFQFQNKVFDFMAQGAGQLVSKKMVEAFSQRAIKLAKMA